MYTLWLIMHMVSRPVKTTCVAALIGLLALLRCSILACSSAIAVSSSTTVNSSFGAFQPTYQKRGQVGDVTPMRILGEMLLQGRVPILLQTDTGHAKRARRPVGLGTVWAQPKKLEPLECQFLVCSFGGLRPWLGK